MRLLKKKRGQSMIEFAIILPVFLLLVLGIAQASLIFVNVLMLKYTAFMTARCAVAYEDPAERIRQTAKARGLMLDMLGVVNGGGTVIKEVQNILSNRLGDKFDKEGLLIQTATLVESKAHYLKVSVGYDMPLNIPVANKVFSLFNRDIKKNIMAYAGHPVYRITATAFMRTDYDSETDSKK